MKVNSYNYPKSSFLSIEKDTQSIVKKILENERLKKLLYYNTKDALVQSNLTEKQSVELLIPHKEKIGEQIIDVPSLIKFVPKVYVDEAEVSYLIISFDNFFPTNNPEFRDCVVEFDIICHFSLWNLDNMQLRPYKIAAELDSMFNNARLSGIGTLQFIGASNFNISGKEYAGISLLYQATHGEDDKQWFDYEYRPENDNDLEENFNRIFNKQ